MADSLFASRYV